MEKLIEYRQAVNEKLDNIMEKQNETLEKIKDVIRNAVASDHILHMFGTGHSHAISEEFFYRAGGLACVNAILEEPLMVHCGAIASTRMERIEGYAQIILDKYATVPGDVMVIFSNSGINPVPIEMALYAKEKGLTVIVFTSIKHSMSQKSRSSTGKRLYEVADYYVDTMIDAGDASLKLFDGSSCAPISSVVCNTILHGILAQVADELRRMNVDAPVLTSANIDGGAARNEAYINKYRARIKHF